MSGNNASSPRRIAVLGSTGSIGVQTLDVARRHPDRIEVVALAAGSRASELLDQAREFGVGHLALATLEGASAEVSSALEELAIDGLAVGDDAAAGLCALEDVDVVVNSLVGAAGLRVSLAAVEAGKTLALANKESLVVGGELIMSYASQPGRLMPIDSEHGAIYQCLLGESSKEVTKLWVTASGGPFSA